MPQARIAALRADPERSRRLSVNTTGSLLFLVLGTNPKAGAIADVRVRQAVNYAIDKVAYRDAIAGRYAATGELASTILAPGSLGYRPYDLYPTPGGRGDPAKARALLAQAGYPNGLTLGFATLGSGRLAGRQKADRGIPEEGRDRPEGHHQPEGDPHFEALRNPAKRLEHQLAQSGWVLDYLGDNARQSIVPQYDSRLPGDDGNFSEYDNPEVNRLIDRALAEPDRDRRAAMWGRDRPADHARRAPGPAALGEGLVPVGLPGPRLGVRPLGGRARPHRRVAGPPEPLTAASAPGRPGPRPLGRPAPCRSPQRRPEDSEARSSADLPGRHPPSTQPSGRQQTGSRRPL